MLKNLLAIGCEKVVFYADFRNSRIQMLLPGRWVGSVSSRFFFTQKIIWSSPGFQGFSITAPNLEISLPQISRLSCRFSTEFTKSSSGSGRTAEHARKYSEESAKYQSEHRRNDVLALQILSKPHILTPKTVILTPFAIFETPGLAFHTDSFQEFLANISPFFDTIMTEMNWITKSIFERTIGFIVGYS